MALGARWRAPVAGMLGLLWLAPFFAACSARDEAAGPNVLVYLVDTLRRDRLGVYGYPRDTSPRLDAFAREAIVFENAYSPTSWTRPAAASLLSGLSPVRHRTSGRAHRLPEGVALLGEHFQAAGYRTLAVSTNPNVIPLWGFDRGFDRFDDLDSTGNPARADAVVDHTLAALAELPPDQPFFYYVHTMDPHTPYDPPPDYAQKFAKNEIDGPGLYDGEIAFGDAEFGRLLDRLRELGRYDDTLIVYVSDHGEELGDHGGYYHGVTLFEEVVRIPLLIRLPGNARAGERVARLATLMDILPTLLAAAGRDVPDGLDGIDLLADGDPAEERPVFFDLTLDFNIHHTNVLRGVRSGRFKYVRRTRPVERELLFDLAEDPNERNNLAMSQPGQIEPLAALLDARLASHASGVHLRLRNSYGAGSRRCVVRLETAGRFVDPRASSLEDGDRLSVGEHLQSLRLDAMLHNTPNPTGSDPVLIIDEDALVFDVDPPESTIELRSLPVGKRKACPVWYGRERTPLEAKRLRFDTGSEALAIRDPATLIRRDGARSAVLPQGIYLGVVEAPKALEEVPEEVNEALRQLGYIE